MLWRRGRQLRLRCPRPSEEVSGELARVAPTEVRKCTDPRVTPCGKSDDLGMAVGVVPPLRGDMEIGRDVAHGEIMDVESNAQVCCGQVITDKG